MPLEAVRSALPGCVQVSDRWHLWHGLAEAAAKEVAAHSACWADGAPLQEGKRAETTPERWQQVRDLRSKGAGLLDCSRRLALSLNTVKRYDRADAPERLQRAPQDRPALVDPYRDHLRKRRAENPGIPVQQLLREIRELGYQGSSNLLLRYVNQGRADSDRPHLAPRKAAQLLLTKPENLTDGQRETAARLSSACPEMKALASLIRSFAAMLDPDPGNEDRLQQWITGARAAGLPHLHSFTRGPDLDIKAATAALTLPHHNGRTEGVSNKTKMIKRQMFGRAGFDLLRHRILLGGGYEPSPPKVRQSRRLDRPLDCIWMSVGCSVMTGQEGKVLTLPVSPESAVRCWSPAASRPPGGCDRRADGQPRGPREYRVAALGFRKANDHSGSRSSGALAATRASRSRAAGDRVIRKLLRRRPPPERDEPSRELIPFYSVDEALEFIRDQALAFDSRGQRSGYRPDLTAKVASLEAVNAVAWCRFLNAFPESDFAVPGAGYRGWIQAAEDRFIFVDETGCGRSGRALPPDVDPASVPRVSLDRASTPGRDALEAAVDRVEQALAHGWAADNANEVLTIAHRVLDREVTLRAYGEHYKSLCHGAAKLILEGVTPDRRHLDDATLADRLVRADAVMEALVLDAEEAYTEFRADGSTYANAFLAREVWLGARTAEGHGPLNAVGRALIAGASAELPEKAPEAVSTVLVARAYHLMSEDVLGDLIDRIEEEADEQRSQALKISPPDHRTYFNALYRAAAPSRGWLQLVMYLDVTDEIKEGFYGDGFRRRVEQSRHVADELRVRVEDALRGDAQDWSGHGAKKARDAIRDIRARDGESAARLATLERTIHTFQYPRSIEPYLLGEVNNLSWKETLLS